MAQRRSRNRRSFNRRSSNAGSDIFQENTDIIDNDDPLWFDRTIVRPSTSVILSRRSSSVLNSDSNVNESRVSDEWYNNLSQSNTSKLMEEAVRQNINRRIEIERRYFANELINNDSESDKEIRKKRSKFGLNRKNKNQTSTTNAFLNALEKTTESTTKNVTHAQINRDPDSESTNDESKTIKRLRPRIFRGRKSVQENTKNYDEVFHSDSASDKNNTSRIGTRSQKKKSIDTENSRLVTLQELTNTSSKDVISNDSSGINKDKTAVESFKKNLRDPNILEQSTLLRSLGVTANDPNKGSDTNDADKESDINDAPNVSRSRTKNLQKKRSTLFSQRSTNQTNSNLFDAVFQENNDDNDLVPDNEESNQRNSSKKQINESENSTIPKNIRRTRTLSEFLRKKEIEMEAKEKSIEKNKSIQNSSNTTSINKSNKNVSKTSTSKQNENTELNSNISRGSKFQESSLNDENVADKMQTRNNKSKRNSNDLSENQSSPKDIIKSLRKIPLMQKSTNILEDSANDTQVDTNSDMSEISEENYSKKGKKLLKRKNTSKTKRKSSAKKSKVQNSSQNSSKLRQTSKKNQPTISSMITSVEKEKKNTGNKEPLSDSESSTIPQYIRRTRSQAAFQNSKSKEDDIVLTLHLSDQPSNQSSLSNSNLHNVSNPESGVFKVPRVSLQRVSAKTSVSPPDNNQNENGIDGVVEEPQESTKKTVTRKTNESRNKSHTSDAATSKINKSNEIPVEPSNEQAITLRSNSKKLSNAPLRKLSSASDEINDDLLQTPNPAQSTLNPSGKPFTRITQFSFRNSDLGETSSSQSSNASLSGNSKNVSKGTQKSTTVKDKVNAIISNLKEIPLAKEQDTAISEQSEEELSPSKIRSKKFGRMKNTSTIEASVWFEVQKRMDLMKEATLARIEHEKEIRKKEDELKRRTEAKAKHNMIIKINQIKKKKRPPINKAFLVNGKLYKRPKLPRPKKWVSDRLYKYLWKCMEPKFGLETRLKSELFIKKLSDYSSVIIKRKKYENYISQLDELIIIMAELNIIKTRYDFYRFCSEYMPYNFRIKVVPMQLPGNIKNIPYDPETVNDPIIDDNSEED